MIEIKMVRDIDFGGATLIEGFPGIGLVGPMAISYIIDKLEMKYIGYFESDDFPPIISIHDSKPLPPVRLYYSDKKKIVAAFAEFAIPLALVKELSDTIFKFATDKKISSIISIGGIPSKAVEDGTVYAIASTPEMLKQAEKDGLNPIIDGVSAGVSALLLFKASEISLPDTNILVAVEPSIIDPKYAELAINSINKLLKLNIDITELVKEAKDVEAKIQDMLKKNKETHDNYKDAVSHGAPSMYA
jgi:uncharacterized protein